MASEILVGIVVAILLAWAVWKLFPAASRRWLQRALTARRVIGALFYAITALAFLNSGIATLQLIGVLMVFAAVLYLFVNEPDARLGSLGNTAERGVRAVWSSIRSVFR